MLKNTISWLQVYRYIWELITYTSPRIGDRNSNMDLEKVFELYLQTLWGPLKVNLGARGPPELAIWTQAKFSMDWTDAKNVIGLYILHGD